MPDQSNPHKVFKCYYTDAPLSDRIFVWTMSVCMIIVLITFASSSKTGNKCLAVIFVMLYMFIPLWFEYGIYMMRTRSIIELVDNEIVVRGWIRFRKSFPVDKIESIRVVDFDTDKVGKLTNDYMLARPMGRVNLCPRKGVIVFFERKWIKSVRPVFFNAADPDQFANALSEASGKMVSN